MDIDGHAIVSSIHILGTEANPSQTPTLMHTHKGGNTPIVLNYM